MHANSKTKIGCFLGIPASDTGMVYCPRPGRVFFYTGGALWTVPGPEHHPAGQQAAILVYEMRTITKHAAAGEGDSRKENRYNNAIGPSWNGASKQV